jgi:hypothetical protein
LLLFAKRGSGIEIMIIRDLEEVVLLFLPFGLLCRIVLPLMTLVIN